ncbi:hypothetical protein R0135_14225 [Congregibacter variabilis]|uniref:Uncharacterized protein n=1 Tax=Congregibacter variabilis TaxID=3081200 RepID=A0ABZ0I088_9GAMM|nr:hypothetical protein R0135_14225 [Congregibacter sp. IMCC43200]
MILRRVIDAIREQSWLTVSVELALVAVGVLIALQADNWNRERGFRELEIQYLERLYDDMQDSLRQQLNYREWNSDQLSAQQVVITALRRGTLLEDERPDFQRGLAYVGDVNAPSRQWGTVEELKSTGNLAIIRDIELRKMLARTDADYLRVRQFLAKKERGIVAIQVELQKHFAPRFKFGFDNLENLSLDYDFDALSSDREFQNLLSHADLSSQTIDGFFAILIERTRALRDRIGVLLGKPPAASAD